MQTVDTRGTYRGVSLRRVGRGVSSPLLARCGIIVLLFLVWELAAEMVVDPAFLSPPSRVFGALFEIFADGRIVNAIIVTFWELALAYVLSIVIGVAIGLSVGLHRFSYRSMLPLILLVYSIPQVTVLPLFVMYFGIGPASKVAFGVSHGMFPIILNVIAGVQSINQVLVISAYSMGASRSQILWRVIIPHMIPSFFTGMRLAMSASLLGVLLAELYVSVVGIGYYTKLFSQSFQPSKMFALVAVLAGMAVLLNEVVRRVEIRFSHWKN